MAAFPPKTVAVVTAVSITIGWLLGSTLSPPVARLQSLPEQPSAVRTPQQPAFTEQLRLRKRETTVEPIMRRNPFTFATPDRERVRDEPSVESDASTAPAPSSAATAPSAPPLTVAGIGVSPDALTAILTDGTRVHVVKTGDVVEGYEVVEITERGVILRDPSGAQLTLDLP